MVTNCTYFPSAGICEYSSDKSDLENIRRPFRFFDNRLDLQKFLPPWGRGNLPHLDNHQVLSNNQHRFQFFFKTYTVGAAHGL